MKSIFQRPRAGAAGGVPFIVVGTCFGQNRRRQRLRQPILKALLTKLRMPNQAKEETIWWCSGIRTLLLGRIGILTQKRALLILLPLCYFIFLQILNTLRSQSSSLQQQQRSSLSPSDDHNWLPSVESWGNDYFAGQYQRLLYQTIRDTLYDRVNPFPNCPAASPPPRSNNSNSNSHSTNRNETTTITVVTSYIHLGEFKKVHGEPRKPTQYKRWLRILCKIRNPIIFYTDSDEFAEVFLQTRVDLGLASPGLSKVVMVNRTRYWSFQQLPAIRRVLARSDHPRHPPAMTVPEYCSTMSAKYDFLLDAIESDYLSDLGWFRHYPLKETPSTTFRLVLPPGFNPDCVAMNEVGDSQPPSLPVTYRQIYEEAYVIVGGGLILGSRDRIVTHVQDYRKAFVQLLEWNYTGSEQQVLYAMYADSQLRHIVQPRVQLQRYFMLFPQPYNVDRWFYLGYVMMKHD